MSIIIITKWLHILWKDEISFFNVHLKKTSLYWWLGYVDVVECDVMWEKSLALFIIIITIWTSSSPSYLQHGITKIQDICTWCAHHHTLSQSTIELHLFKVLTSLYICNKMNPTRKKENEILYSRIKSWTHISINPSIILFA